MKTIMRNRFKKMNIIFLAGVIFMVPLIVYLKILNIPESLFPYYKNLTQIDLFAYHKAQLLFGASILFLIVLFIYSLDNKKKHEINIFSVLLLLFLSSVIISFVFSEYKDVAWLGSQERFEGTKIWLAYIVLCFVTYFWVDKEEELKILVTSFVFSSFFVSFIGFFQMMGKDLYKTNFGKRIILGSYYDQIADSLVYRFAEGRVYTTLYNPNYVGSFIALAFPLSIYCVMTYKRIWIKILFLIIAMFQMLALYGSQSTGGLIALIVGLILIGINIIAKTSKKTVAFVGVLIFITVSLVSIQRTGIINNQINKIVNNIQMDTRSEDLFDEVNYKENILKLYLKNGRWIELTADENMIIVNDRFLGIIDHSESDSAFSWAINGDTYKVDIILNKNTRTVLVTARDITTEVVSRVSFSFYYQNHFSMGRVLFTEDNVDVRKIPIFSNESFFSNRGYIWNRTLYLIKERPIVGYGADTFLVNFPQTDVLERYGNFEPNILVDKAHNFFLQLLMNFGIYGFLVFLVLCLWIIVKKRSNILVIGLISFLVAGLVNDSTVGITYMVFILLGGLAKLIVIQKKKEYH